MISRGGYGEKEGPKYGGPISFIMINVRDAVYCTCTDPGPCRLEIWVQPPETSLEALPQDTSRLDPQVQDPLGQMAIQFLILAVYTVNLLNSWQSEQNWPIGQIRSKTLQLQRKVVARSVANPVSKLANRPKTGQIFHTSTIRFSALARSGQKLAKKLANTSVTSVTQITESLSTRRTRWYNRWYNNHLKES